MSPAHVNAKGEIEYDVSHVPWPSLKDPKLGELTATARIAQPREPLPVELDKYRLFSVEELGEFPPVEWLIDKRLARGELTVFYGKGDTYKSFVALDASCCLAAAGHFVIYIVAEGATGIRARIAAWMKHHGLDELPNLWLMPSNINLHEKRDVAAWVEAMRLQLGERTPSLVVVDTLARNFVGGSENDPKDLGLFVDGVEFIRRELETAVLVLHHSTKDGTSERGTEALRNASFAVFRFERVNQSLQVNVGCERMKDAEQPPPQRVAGQKVPLPALGEDVSSLVVPWSSSQVDPSQSERPESRPESTGPEKALLRALADPSQDPRRAALAKRLKVSEETVKRTKKALLDKGFIKTEGKTSGTQTSLTEAGREAMK